MSADTLETVDTAIRTADAIVGRAIAMLADREAEAPSPEGERDMAEIVRLAGQLRGALLGVRAAVKE